MATKIFVNLPVKDLLMRMNYHQATIYDNR